MPKNAVLIVQPKPKSTEKDELLLKCYLRKPINETNLLKSGFGVL